MNQLSHLFPIKTGTVERYTYPGQVGSARFRIPPRDCIPHSESLIEQIQSAEREAKNRAEAQAAIEKPKGIVLDFQSAPAEKSNKGRLQEFKLKLESLEANRSGIELRNVRVDLDGIMHASVFVPDGKISHFIRKIEAYANPSKNTGKGLPANNDLVASISQIHLAALQSFWMDANPFPTEKDSAFWWEVWLCEGTGAHDVVDDFRSRAPRAGVLVSTRSLRFPDRRIVIARATVEQLLAIENLFDILAELRSAKILAGNSTRSNRPNFISCSDNLASLFSDDQ